jgi:integrase
MGQRPKLKLPKHVHGFVDRHGRPRYYLRRPGFRAVPLFGLPFSPDFMTAYDAALAGHAAPVEIGASRTISGTVNALVAAYYKSIDWDGLTDGTRKARRRYIERFRAEHGNKRVAMLGQRHLEQMLSEIVNPFARKEWLVAIKGLMKSAVPTMRQDDPAKGIPNIKLPKSKGHHTWSDDEIRQYRDHWPLGTQQRLVFEFALETASRRGEVVRLGPQHVKNGRIRIERTHGSADVDIPISAELQAACDAMPKRHLTYIITAQGKPRSKGGLGNDFAKWATAAGLPARCRMHGLKKGGMRRLAEAGATTHMLMAVSGHKSLSEVERYTAAADRRKLAGQAMALKDQSENGQLANLPPQTRKPGLKSQ